MPISRKINRNFFKIWSQDMSYVLGFFAADGYVTVNRRGSCFWNIQITDYQLLNRIRNAIRSNHRIGIRKPKNHEKTLYRLQIGSKEMCNDLNDLGMRIRKTKSMKLPDRKSVV